MNRQQFLGIALILVIIVGYGIWVSPSAEQRAEIQRKQDSTRQVKLLEQQKLELEKHNKDSISKLSTDTASLANTTLSDSAKSAEKTEKFGVFAKYTEGKAQDIVLENKLLEVKISTLGAYPYYVRLKDFKAFKSDSLVLFDKGENVIDLKFFAQNHPISTENLYFTNTNPTRTHIVADADSQSVALRIDISQTQYLEYVYTIQPNSYELGVAVNFVGMTDYIPQNTFEIDMFWDAKLRRLEKGADWENQNTTAYYKYDEAEVDKLSPTSDDDDVTYESKLKWLAYKNHFFASAIIAHGSFASGKTAFVADPKEEHYLKHFKSELALPYDAKTDNRYAFTWYLGPNDYDILTDTHIKPKDDLELKRMIPLGWALFRWISQYAIIPLFNLLGSFIGSMGLLILVMTVLIKAVLFPLTYKSYQSSAKMQVLKPQIDEINEKIPKDKAMERQQATMALYKKAGVNPLGGCLPMLLQFPILIAMYQFFPGSIELRGKSFLWAEDLSTYDSIWNFPNGFTIPMYGDHISLFTLLMAAAMLISTMMNSSQMQSNQQMPGMKLMLYLMPVMMLVWFNNYSAGLSYYYFLSNVITIVQIWAARKLINKEKILAKLNENQKKNKEVPKSKFQQRLDQMAKERGIQPLSQKGLPAPKNNGKGSQPPKRK